MRRSPLVPALLLLLLTTQSASAQGAGAAPSADDLQRANAAFVAADWSSANAQYRAIAERYPKHAIARLRWGVTLTELGKPAEGEPHIRAAEALGAPVPQSAYRLAESLAERGKSDGAIAELRRAITAGLFIPPSALQGNAHLRSLRSRGEWASVLDALDAQLQPCKHDAKFRQLDFWVGDWDVRPTNGPQSGPASRNRITLEENSCVVMEHWEGQGGSTGQSFNLYDRSMGKWRQTWVDNVASQHDYVGGLDAKGNMVFEGTTPATSGQLGRVLTRLTLFPIHRDTVRQFSQTSPDSGRTWVVSYDLTYVRRSG